MRNFTKDTAKKILTNEIDVNMLMQQYPEYKEEVLTEFANAKEKSNGNVALKIISTYKSSSQMAFDKISKSNLNEKTVNMFLPRIIKARIAIYVLEQFTVVATAKNVDKKVRLNFWDGTILQKILFTKGLERKAVSLRTFNFWWRFITNKKVLMPLVNQKGVYCFYTKELVNELVKLVGDKKCIEIAAGDGMLTKFLNDKGVGCVATDDYSWKQYISFPSFVEKADAKAALKKYKPQVVICSWPVAGNSYEKHVFATDSVNMYIVIGTNNPLVTGDFNSYNRVRDFEMELNSELSVMVLPPLQDNAVYVFKRKSEK